MQIASRRQLRIEPLEPRAMLSGSSALLAAPAVGIVATDASAAETRSTQPADAGLLTVSRAGSTTAALTVRYTIAGSAANGADYTRLAGSVVIAKGQASAAVSIAPIDDALVEGDETVKLTLAAGWGYTIDSAHSTASVTIHDNDFPDPAIASVAGEVQQANTTAAIDCYLDYFTSLPVNQGAQRGYSQKTAQPDLVAARSTIFAELGAALAPGGGSVSYQDFTVGGFAGRNIVGVLPGAGTHKTQLYVIGGHYDSVQNPGADDDASGVAGLLEAARVMARHKFDATVVFVAFDQEEQRTNGWGVGSKFYADAAKAAGADLRGMVALDMIAFNSGANNIVFAGQADASPTSSSAALTGRLAQALDTYTTLTVRQTTGMNETDAYRFYQDGFAASTVIEQLTNPYYHTAADYYLSSTGQPQQYQGRAYLDFAYAAQMTKGAVAWAATDAVLLDLTKAAADALRQAVAISGAAPARLATVATAAAASPAVESPTAATPAAPTPAPARSGAAPVPAVPRSAPAPEPAGSRLTPALMPGEIAAQLQSPPAGLI